MVNLINQLFLLDNINKETGESYTNYCLTIAGKFNQPIIYQII